MRSKLSRALCSSVSTVSQLSRSVSESAAVNSNKKRHPTTSLAFKPNWWGGFCRSVSRVLFSAALGKVMIIPLCGLPGNPTDGCVLFPYLTLLHVEIARFTPPLSRRHRHCCSYLPVTGSGCYPPRPPWEPGLSSDLAARDHPIYKTYKKESPSSAWFASLSASRFSSRGTCRTEIFLNPFFRCRTSTARRFRLASLLFYRSG